MFVQHLIAEILDLQKQLPVTQEEKFTKEELEYLTEKQLEELKFNYHYINGHLLTHDSIALMN